MEAVARKPKKPRKKYQRRIFIHYDWEPPTPSWPKGRLVVVKTFTSLAASHDFKHSAPENRALGYCEHTL